MKRNTFIIGIAWVCMFTMVNPVHSIAQTTNPVIKSGTQKVSSGRIKGPDGYLYYEDGGQGGTPVVFVHAFGGSTDQWQPQLDQLRKSRRAVAFDFRGHGRSDSPRSGDYSVKSLAVDIATVVNGLGLKNFILVGHSMGGSAAIAYAGKYPQRVEGLLLSGTPGKSTEEETQSILVSLESDSYNEVMGKYLSRMLEGAKPWVDSLEREGLSRLSKKTSINIIKGLFQFDPLPSLQNYAGPKLIVAPERAQQTDALHRQMPSVPFQTVGNASHWTQLDNPQEFNRILMEFLGTLEMKN